MDLKGYTPFLLGHMVYVDDHSHFSCLSFIQSNSEVFDHVKRFLADTALFRSTFTWCCLRCDNADDNTCVMMRTWPVGNGDGIETSSAHERHDEPWQNREVEAHIGHASNMNRTIVISNELKGAFWARAFSCANDAFKVLPSTCMSMTRLEAIHACKPNLTNFQSSGVECWIHVRAEQRRDIALDPQGEPTICLGHSITDKICCRVCHVFSKVAFSREIILFTDNLVFGHTFLINQHGLDLPWNLDVAPKGSLLYVDSVVNSVIAEIVAQDAIDFVITLHSGPERLMLKSMPDLNVSEGQRRAQSCFHVLDNLGTIEAHALAASLYVVTGSTASKFIIRLMIRVSWAPL